MVHLTYSDYVQHRQHAIKNQEEICKSNMVGCYLCYGIERASCVTEYDDEGTALCPKCGIHALIGDASGLPLTDAAFLKHMHFYAFDHIVLQHGGLTVKKRHAAMDCDQCMMVNYLDHIDEILPDKCIVIAQLKSYGGPCPWQWDGVTVDGKDVYIRERGGILRIDVGDFVYLLMKDIDNFDGYNDLMRLTGKYVIYPQGDVAM